MKRNYSLSTTDPEAFRRLVDAAAGLGSFQMLVTEIKDPNPAPGPRPPERMPDRPAVPLRQIDPTPPKAS